MIITRLTSRCLEHKQSSRVGGSALCDVVSSFLCHTHIDGKDKLLEWPDRSCLLLYVSLHPLKRSLAKSIFVSRVRKTAKKIFVSRNVIIRRLTSRCLVRKQPSRVGGSPVCDVVSSFLYHTHIDGKDKLLEWPELPFLLLYVSARIH